MENSDPKRSEFFRGKVSATCQSIRDRTSAPGTPVVTIAFSPEPISLIFQRRIIRVSFFFTGIKHRNIFIYDIPEEKKYPM
jgi:hypothetical protein